MGRPTLTTFVRAQAWVIAVLVPLVLIGGAREARAQPLLADLSDHLIAITTAFTGADVVLFGAVDEPGDVVVVVRGPPQRTIVRLKSMVAGIWINTDSMEFDEVPSYYTVASNRPIGEIAGQGALGRHDIGLEHLRLAPVRDDIDPSTLTEYREALVRNKQRQGLYAIEPGRVAFLGQQLFRTNVYFPSNVPTGQYIIQVFLIRDGAVVSAQTTPLVVSKIGVGAAIFAFAQRQSAAYGAIAIVTAALAGWLGSVIFRRT